MVFNLFKQKASANRVSILNPTSDNKLYEKLKVIENESVKYKISGREFYFPPKFFNKFPEIYVYEKFIGSIQTLLTNQLFFIDYFYCLNNDYVMISLMHELEVQLVRALANVVNFRPSGAFKPITWRCIHNFIYCTIINYSK